MLTSPRAFFHHKVRSAEMVSDKRYFTQRASEEAMRAERAPSEDARQWHQELADKFNRLACEVEDFAHQPSAPPPTVARERRAALG
jgi:hypothetical protein